MTSTYPYFIYDDSYIPDPFEYGERAVEFFRYIRHQKSNLPGRAFQLDPWQERIIRRIYGPRNPDGTRIVKVVVLLLPRGNRKTSLSSALALLHTIGPERVPGGEVIFAASDREQAGIGFREAMGIIRCDKRLVAATKIYDAHNSAKKIVFKRDNVTLQSVSSDAGAQHGRTPSFVLADELHIWGSKGRLLWEALTTGLDKTDNPLLVVATTAGRGQDNIAWDIIEDARKVARGEVDDPSILPILFEADREADWADEALWHRVNPGLIHGYPSLDGMRRHAKRAMRSPGERDSFWQLKLNIWLDHSTSPYVDMSVFDEGAGPIDFDALEGQPCWIGVDMSTTTDLTAVVACFRNKEVFTVVPYLFCPAESLRARGERDGVPYPTWAEQGFIHPTPGNVIDYRAVEQCIRDLCSQYDVREIAFDRTFAQPVMAPLIEDDFPVFVMPLDPKSQAAGVNTLERAIVGRNFRYGGNPALRWCFSNIAIYTGPSGLRTMHKGRSIDRIDGAFATWMAVARAAAGDEHRSWLDDPSISGKDLVI